MSMATTIPCDSRQSSVVDSSRRCKRSWDLRAYTSYRTKCFEEGRVAAHAKRRPCALRLSTNWSIAVSSRAYGTSRRIRGEDIGRRHPRIRSWYRDPGPCLGPPRNSSSRGEGSGRRTRVACESAREPPCGKATGEAASRPHSHWTCLFGRHTVARRRNPGNRCVCDVARETPQGGSW